MLIIVIMTSKIMTVESSQNMILMGVLFFRFVPGVGQIII